jgi:drug/metabolite transporter (DMT)-like permease
MKTCLQKQSSKKSIAIAIVLLFMAVFCRSLAFVFAKYAALKSIGSGIVGIIFNYYYWAEIMALGFQMIFWIMVLKRLRLNVAYLAMSSVYAINLAWAWYLFDEKVSFYHIIGCAIIIFGIVLAISAQEVHPT